MKKIFNTSVCILLAALCIQPVYAKTDMPSACPAVAALATVGVHVAGSPGERRAGHAGRRAPRRYTPTAI